MSYLNFVVLPQGDRWYLMALLRPPCGWSTGFLATPRVIDFLPARRLHPALLLEHFLFSGRATHPLDPTEYIENTFLTPEGSFIRLALVRVSSLSITDLVPTPREYLMPSSGSTSISDIGWFFGKFLIRKKLVGTVKKSLR